MNSVLISAVSPSVSGDSGGGAASASAAAASASAAAAKEEEGVVGEVELQRYTTDDLRISIVYRARCFEDEEQARLFDGRGGPTPMNLEAVLAELSKGLVELRRVGSVDEALRMNRRKLAMLLMDTYIRYPLTPERLVPYNYCALPRLLPASFKAAAAWLLRPLCRPMDGHGVRRAEGMRMG